MNNIWIFIRKLKTLLSKLRCCHYYTCVYSVNIKNGKKKEYYYLCKKCGKVKIIRKRV